MVLTHAWKDIKRMLRDRKALLITILMPTLLTVILGLSIGQMMSGGDEIDSIPIGIVDQSTAASFQQQDTLGDNEINFAQIFMNQILESTEVQELVSYNLYTRAEALRQLEEGELSSVILFSESYNQDVVNAMSQPSAESVKVTLYQNPDQSLHNEVIKGILESYTDQLSKSVIAKDTMISLMMKEPNLQQEITSSMGDVLQGINQTNQPSISFVRQTFGEIKSLTGMQYFTAGMAVMFMLYVGGYSAIYVRDELQSHTYNRLRSMGMTFWQLAGGKFISTSLLVFFQISFLFLFEKLIFGMDLVNIGLLLIMIIATSLAVSSLAILLITITIVNQKTRLNELFQSIIIPFMAMLGGSFISISIMPEPIQMLGHNILNGAALQGFSHVMQGYPLSGLIEPILALLINGLVFLAVSSVIMMKKREVFR